MATKQNPSGNPAAKKSIVATFFHHPSTVIWFSISVFLSLLLVAVNVAATVYLPGLMDTLFGGETSSKTGVAGAYYSPSEGVSDKKSALAHANATNETICEEGFVLLKNSQGALPLATGAKISVFGKNSVAPVYGSTGSVGAVTSNATTLYSSLESAGFSLNPTLRKFYEDSSRSGSGRAASPSMSSNSIVTGFEIGETPLTSYSADVRSSFAEYPDVAVVVLSRISGENYDMPLTMKDGAGNPVKGAARASDHYLELDQNEQEMLKMACENFPKVVLLINSATPLELGFLDGDSAGDASLLSYDYASHVQACLWLGLPGESGLGALGKILKGEVNPSGRTVDTYARDFLSIPALKNFACNGVEGSDAYTRNGSPCGAYFSDYEEGIYVGYRYFETQAAVAGEDWYQKNVIYPFGYGLSYTQFQWEIANQTAIDGASLSAGDPLKVQVKVTNTGKESGKDVVELYGLPPYRQNGIEKAAKVLLDEQKTSLLAPGASETLNLTIDPYLLASFDEEDKNGDGVKGYEVEAGNYGFAVSANAHQSVLSFTLNAPTTIVYSKDPQTQNDVVNRFADLKENLGSVLSRADFAGTFPVSRSAQEKEITQAFLDRINASDSGNPLDENSAVVKENAASRPAASVIDAEEIKNKGTLLYALIGKSYADPLWTSLIKELTMKTMWNLLSKGSFNTAAIDYIGKPGTLETDGPAGFVNFMDQTGKFSSTAFYSCECVLASTWNPAMAYAFGESIGNEGLIGTGTGTPYSGLYAPGINLHRTPFGGRNPEYYSEDPVLSGKMAVNVIKGAKSKGVYMVMKHFACNEQETHRGGVCTWLNEQSMRELYLKPFELAIKGSDGTCALMSSFNRIGTRWSGGDYRLMTSILREEWGFKGLAVTDFASGQAHMNSKQMIYAGGDLWFDTITPSSWYDSKNALDVYLVQEASKHLLYTVVNSNAMNGLGQGGAVLVREATWRSVLRGVDIALPILLLGWGVPLLIKIYRKPRSDSPQA